MDRELILLGVGFLIFSVCVAFRYMSRTDSPPPKPVSIMSVKELTKTQAKSKKPVKCKRK